MSSCPLGFKGDLPAGHPSVAGLTSTFTGTDDSSSDWTISILILDFIFLALVVLSLIYNDRGLFTASRKEIPAVKPAYPIIGSLPWLLKVSSRKVKLIDEIYKFQNSIGKGNKPITFSAIGALGGRVTILNHPAYINWVQKTNFENYVS